MVLEFLQGISSTDTLLILVIFLLFVISIKKIIGIVMNFVWIAVAAVLFPLVANRFLGLPIPTDLNTIVTFVVVGVGAYLLYLVSKSVYSVAKLVAKIGGKITPKGGGKKEKPEARRVEKPVKYQPIKHHAKKHRPQSEKELLKDYVVIEDAEAGEKKAKKSAKQHDARSASIYPEKIKEIKFGEKEKKKREENEP